MKQYTAITNKTLALQRAAELTGLGHLAAAATAEEVTLRNLDVPFLSEQYQGRRVWRVVFDKVLLELESATPGYLDLEPRLFVVLLDQESGRLIQISSVYTGEAPNMKPEPPASLAQEQLEGEDEIYHSLPDNWPEHTFVQALDLVLEQGKGSPFEAKEIDGLYVMHSRMGSKPIPAWIITLRGLPPFSAHGAGGDSVPAWQRNHIRNVIDDLSWKVLYANNSPQPEG